ncbi:hypothetical protein [Micrococcus sp. IITD107]|uniref:hypothetical protein n=1 Tax=Micrococcus sp. IITD107 TaxID=3342790 RepID=UPI0035BAFEBD
MRTTLPDHWIEHHREGGERVGWIVPAGADFLAFDALGRQATREPVDWLTAEEALEELGLRFLGDRFVLDVEGTGGSGGATARPVRIAEVSTDGITVVTDEFGGASAVGSGAQTIRLPFPAPDTLRSADGQR